MINSFLEELIDKWKSQEPLPPTSIAIVTPEKTYYKSINSDEYSIFQLASVSKFISSIAIADECCRIGKNLYERRLFDDDVKTSSTYVNKNATVSDALSHRTGLDDTEPNSITQMMLELGVPRSIILKKLKYLPFSNSLRERYNYNNFIYSWGIQRADGNYIIPKFLNKLQMNRTYIKFKNYYNDSNRILSHRLIQSSYREKYIRNLDADYSAGGISSCTSDLVKFVEFFLNNPNNIRLAIEPQVYISRNDSFYGRGISIKYTSAGTIYSHNGILEEGNHNIIKIVPNMKSAVIVLSAGYPAVGVEAIADAVLFYLHTNKYHDSIDIFIQEMNGVNRDIEYPSISLRGKKESRFISDGIYQGVYFNIEIKGNRVSIANSKYVKMKLIENSIYSFNIKTISGLSRLCYLTIGKEKLSLYYLDMKFIFPK